MRLLGLRSRWARWVCVRPRLLGLRLLIACARWAC
ncbi:hypothetical protein JOF35_005737 [Streptomyces demainii]|uniref:Uncharacterized protein n=1 Tax=Streptomyces demainii TaxID=588122 RepID=A0ABT9KYG3_9ACTN|nr:hypothetical protein [Streptomyces demainii]